MRQSRAVAHALDDASQLGSDASQLGSGGGPTVKLLLVDHAATRAGFGWRWTARRRCAPSAPTWSRRFAPPSPSNRISR